MTSLWERPLPQLLQCGNCLCWPGFGTYHFCVGHWAKAGNVDVCSHLRDSLWNTDTDCFELPHHEPHLYCADVLSVVLNFILCNCGIDAFFVNLEDWKWTWVVPNHKSNRVSIMLGKWPRPHGTFAPGEWSSIDVGWDGRSRVVSLLSLEPEGQPAVDTGLSEYHNETGSTVWTQGRSTEQGLWCMPIHV